MTVLSKGPACVLGELICWVGGRSRTVVLVGLDALVHVAGAEATEVKVGVIRTGGKRVESIGATELLLRRVHAVGIGRGVREH